MCAPTQESNASQPRRARTSLFGVRPRWDPTPPLRYGLNPAVFKCWRGEKHGAARVEDDRVRVKLDSNDDDDDQSSVCAWCACWLCGARGRLVWLRVWRRVRRSMSVVEDDMKPDWSAHSSQYVRPTFTEGLRERGSANIAQGQYRSGRPISAHASGASHHQAPHATSAGPLLPGNAMFDAGQGVHGEYVAFSDYRPPASSSPPPRASGGAGVAGLTVGKPTDRPGQSHRC